MATRQTCHECHRVLEADEQACPACGSTTLTEDWSGYVIILHPATSEIAEKMDVSEPGTYALKVR